MTTAIDADEVLSQVLELYQSCSSYLDSGEALCEMGSLEFKTWFCRPNKFRFEWSSKVFGAVRSGVLFSESDSKSTSFDGKNHEDAGRLALAIAGATGTSLGVAPLVAHLLMPNLFEAGKYQSLVSLRPYKLIEDSDSYIKIQADWRTNCWTALCVDKKRFAISKIEIGFTPTLEEKEKGIEAMELPEGPELDEVRALLLVEESPQPTVISYKVMQFDVSISPQLFQEL
ncbi:hypothetical protein BH10CYA1_BH10CYA1_61340 [soil metagenome]